MGLDEIKLMCERFTPVGSRVTCNPPVMNTDADYLVLVTPERFGEFWCALTGGGFDLDGSRIKAEMNTVGNPDAFQSFSREKINIIATASEEFYNRFMAASSIAKRLNLLKKADRIALFQAVLYATVDPAMAETPSSIIEAVKVFNDAPFTLTRADQAFADELSKVRSPLPLKGERV